jgi:hypothetical protein
MNPRVRKVKAIRDYRLEITFANGEVGIYDCRPLLGFGVFGEFEDEAYFRQVRVAGGTVVWPHEQDICPDTLYLDSGKRRQTFRRSKKVVAAAGRRTAARA